MKRLQRVDVAGPAVGEANAPAGSVAERSHCPRPGVSPCLSPLETRVWLLWMGFQNRALTLLVLVACLNQALGAAPDVTKEHKLEAVLLFNLARFVDWPRDAFATTNAPLIIGILGRDPFGPALDEVVHGESVNGHPLQVKHCSTVQEAAECQMVFVSSSERPRAKTIVSALRSRPVLTVSDVEAFCRSAGGMVAFYVNEQHRIRVRLNLEAAKAAHLSVSSKLIQVAELEAPSSSMNWLPRAVTAGIPGGLMPLDENATCPEPLYPAVALQGLPSRWFSR